jgi:hypothetical protein
MRCCIAVSSFLFFLLLLVFFCSSPREHHSKSLNSASCEKQGIEQEAKNTAVVKQPSENRGVWDGRELSRG